MKYFLFALLAAVCLGAHCYPGNGCPRGDTRCTNNVAEICDANGSYHKLADCDLVSEQSGAPFVCTHVDVTTEDGHVAGHTCMPASDAAAGGGQ